MGKDKISFSFVAAVWMYKGEGAWHFITVPKAISDDIKIISADTKNRGFGSVRAEVQLGVSSWKTSIFPDSKLGAYILPLKKSVRQQNDIADGSSVSVVIELTDY